MAAVLKESGSGLDKVVKTTVFLKDMNDYTTVNAVYGSYFTVPYPARETIQVGDLPMHVNIEISVIAMKD